MVFRLILTAILTAAGLSSNRLLAQDRPQPKLILQITIDGFRGDLINRYASGFGEGGFRYLLDHGVVYTNAHHDHANTETIVGHTTLATGAYPRDHGMIGNAWLDPTTGELGYNIEDGQHLLIPSREDAATGEQVDPAQAAARSNGRSPRAIHGTTFSDELAVATAGKAKIFAVSGKDRGAVPLAGKSGKAFWYSTDTGDFVTSTYYYDEYPGWVTNWNSQRRAEAFAGQSWELLHEQSSYLLGEQDDRAYEIDLRGYGRVFPHMFGEPADGLFFTRLLVSPIGDKLTLDFARHLVASEQIGVDDVTDYLSVSFSGVDAVNHFFGPSSLENEDVVVQLDRTLAELLAFVDEQVGLANTLVVLSADHGMAEFPEYMQTLGHSVGRLYGDEVVAAANQIGRDLWGVDSLAQLFFRPYLYLRKQAIVDTGFERSAVTESLANRLAGIEGISLSVPQRLQAEIRDEGELGRIQRNYFKGRSGDIYLTQEPYWFLYSRGSIGVAHGSPWKYDSHVPIIFAGAGLTAQSISRAVRTVDVAPTLSGFLGIKHPSNSRGESFVEVVD
jgi:predicted AlkP superfamily pyrophosphatase or phosphodiesterase